jgi:ABC-2 type transport system permease protein
MPLNSVASALLSLLIYDLIFLLILVAVVALLASTKRAAFAVMKRNFFSYFSNPTGYVFLCIFVFLTSVAAFWPYEFFNQNLATLDQLNRWFPLIMLIFIPAITMSVWAEEKRQGTDELLLTLPADDFDIVIGKYMSAAAIFTASLLFSQISTFVTLAILTEGFLDTGLIFVSYVGYWFVGLAMLAIGMIASFVSGNLTVSFILGALFNAPLAFASLAEGVAPSQNIGKYIAASGIARPFDDFGRGVISTSSVAYFLLVAVVAVYTCMVLIGRRHWTGGKDGNTMAWHYIARVLALIVFTVGAVTLFRTRDVFRGDFTEGQVSSLAPSTKQLIGSLDAKRPIIIDAFISKDMPEVYAKTRYELINLLKEFRSEAAKNNRQISVNLYDDIELFSEEAALAEERFGIRPQTRMFRVKGTAQQKQVIIGAAFRSGLEKVTVPIFEYGIPVEYELVRSINTVASGAKKRLGVVETDAQLFGGNAMRGMSFQQIERHPLIDELSKQYEVESVDLQSPITADMYDALLCVQPSSLNPEKFNVLTNAIRLGVPVAVFEDPVPLGRNDITPTGSPKAPMGGGMFGGGQSEPKADIRNLWDLLEIDVPGDAGTQGLYNPALVWQEHNPYPSLEESASPLWIFVDEDAPNVVEGRSLSSDSEITSGMNEVLAIFASAVRAKPDSKLTHTELLRTNANGGYVKSDKLQSLMREGGSLRDAAYKREAEIPIAMTISGNVPAPAEPESTPVESKEKAKEPAQMKVVYVGDSDVLLPEFLMIRRDPDTMTEVKFQFQNVTFVLNCLDWLTNENEFIEVRKHEPKFPNLRMIDKVKEEARQEVAKGSKLFDTEFQVADNEANESRTTRLKTVLDDLEKLRKKFNEGKASQAEVNAVAQKYQTQEELEDRKLAVRQAKMERERDQNIRNIERQAQDAVTKIQNKVKAAAVALPCIPPLVVGLIVFSTRRLRERENISKSRLK